MESPPFYTLSSSGTSSSSYSTAGTPLTPPSPSTHDTSRSSYHVSDLSSFTSSLQDAANQAFPNRGWSRYHTVNVCLIRWEEDELRVAPELDLLQAIFEQFYGFNVELWLIPSTSSQIKLTTTTCNFLQKFDQEGNLFIVYYGGHGTINPARQNQWWCSRSPTSPYVDWSSIQTLFSSCVSDVLILLDCCAAASSAANSGPGTIEAIAACGWETRAPPPGIYSFTNTLCEVLEEWATKPSFSAAMLHTEVLFVLKQKGRDRGRDGRIYEWCSTPVHWVFTNNPKAPGIEISSMMNREAIQKSAEREIVQQPPRSTSYVDAMDLDEDPSINPLMDSRPNGDYRVPHVLISIALEGDQGELDAVACRKWLANFPALAKYASVEGVYKGYSTLLTLSVPVMVWDLLPDHPACSFIGYIASPNKYSSQPALSAPPPRVFPLKRRTTKERLGMQDSSYGSTDGSVVNFQPHEFWESCKTSQRGRSLPPSRKTMETELNTDDPSDETSSLISGFSDLIIKQSTSSSPHSIPGKSLIAWMLETERAARAEGEQATPALDIPVSASRAESPVTRYRSLDQKALVIEHAPSPEVNSEQAEGEEGIEGKEQEWITDMAISARSEDGSLVIVEKGKSSF